MAFDPEIQKAQAFLRQLGYDRVDVGGKSKNLAVDGISGKITQAALQKFREDHQLAADTPMSEMLKKMGEAILEDPQKAAQTVHNVIQQGNGAGRDAVATAQAVMNLSAEFMGEDVRLKIDGDIGPQTRAAYKTLTGQDAPIIRAPDPVAAPAPQALSSTFTEMTIAPAREGPVINVAAGADSPGIAAVDGVIPTVNVGDYTGARAEPTPPLPQLAEGDGGIQGVLVDPRAESIEWKETHAVLQTGPAMDRGAMRVEAEAHATPIASPAGYRIGQRDTLAEYQRQEAGRVRGPDYDYARPQSPAEMRQEEARQRQEAHQIGRDANQAIRNMGALGDNNRGNDINAIGGLIEMGMRRLFSPGS